MSSSESVIRFADRVNGVNERTPWWVMPAAMLGFAALMWASALILTPGPGEWSYFHGHQVGGACGLQVALGIPCPSCGMTRSFVHAARFHLIRSFFYNPAGLTLFWWITAGGVVGAARLVTKNPRKFTPSTRLLFRWTMAWAIGFYAIPWFLRIAGINPLP